ncbi:unnamed protein product [Symbiodinium sp. CCMP2592]|nr:unnamed protein product [Symbiodinium sp. CCMP2592]
MELWIWRSTQMPKIPNNKVPMDTVEVPMMKSATDPTVVMRKLPVVLPHRLIPHLLKHNLVVPDFAAIREYWSHMFTHAEWGPEHPLAEQGGNCKHLPVYLYADDVKWTNEEKLTQVSLGLVLDERTHSMTTHFPLWILREISSLAVFVDRVFDHSGLYEACRLVVDSLNILFRGEVCEPDMEPPLAALTELRADWKFYKETWRTPENFAEACTSLVDDGGRTSVISEILGWRPTFYLADLMNCSEQAGRYLTDAEIQRMRHCTDEFLNAYGWLAKMHSSGSRPLFQIRPKLHGILELIRFCSVEKYNYRYYHTFASEDFNGRLGFGSSVPIAGRIAGDPVCLLTRRHSGRWKAALPSLAQAASGCKVKGEEANSRGKIQRALLEVHHARPVYADYLRPMGRKNQWTEEEWQAWRSSSAQYGGWHKVKGKGKNKEAAHAPSNPRGPKEAVREPKRPAFPSFEMMDASSSSAPQRPMAPTRVAMEIDEEPVTTSQMARGVQRLLNGLRKSEGKARRLEEEKEALLGKWAAFKEELQQSFVKEKAKFNERMTKLGQDLIEAEQAQEEALAGLQLAIAEPQSVLKPKVKVPEDKEALDELENLLKSPEKRPQQSLADILADALNGATGSENTRRQLLQVISARRSQASAVTTPPRRTRGTAARTPEAKDNAPARRPEEMDASYQGDTEEKVEVPLPRSPTCTTNAPTPEGLRRSKSRTATLIPVKMLGRQAQKTPHAGPGLAEKLEAKREAELEALAHVLSSDEDLQIGDLVGGGAGASGEGHDGRDSFLGIQEVVIPDCTNNFDAVANIGTSSRPRASSCPLCYDAEVDDDSRETRRYLDNLTNFDDVISIEASLRPRDIPDPMRRGSEVDDVRKDDQDKGRPLGKGEDYVVSTGHGPSGGHDRGGETENMNDIPLPIIDLLAGGAAILTDWCSDMADISAGWGLTFFGLNLVALAAFCMRPAVPTKVRKRMTFTQPRLCLVWGLLGTLGPTSLAARSSPESGYPSPSRAAPLPRSVADMTYEEQMAENWARWIHDLPLEHGAGGVRLPNYAIPVAETFPDPMEMDIARAHVVCWVATPYHEVEVIDVEMLFPMTQERLRHAVAETTQHIPDYASEYVPCTPQIGDGFASFVAVPPWMKSTERVVQVIDASDIGGGIFAAYVEGPITRQNVLMTMVEGWPEGMQAFAYGSERPMRSGQTYDPVRGGVIKIMRPGARPRWPDDLQSRLDNPQLWNPGANVPGPLDGLHTVYQSADDQVIEEISSDDERTLEVSAEEALQYEHGDVWVVVPEERIPRLSHLGRRVWGQIAVMDGVEQRDRDAPVIFNDLRGLGLFPQWTQVEGTVFQPTTYYESLQMPELEGWTLMVQGGEPRDDGHNIDIHGGEVLVYYLEQLRETPEETDDMEDDDDDSSSSSSSATHDALPGSSELTEPSSGEEPTNFPRGPPPPRPVNEPDRSRSPRRNQEGVDSSEQGAELRIQDFVHPPVYDLTTTTLPFPHTSADVWSMSKPWPGGALRETQPIQTLLTSRCEGQPQIHVYTDGSANDKQRTSGYAVVILLKWGTAIALFGIIGGQLLGNEKTPWPLAGPAALTAEQVAVAAALLWVVQARTMLPHIDCRLYVDCLAAGRAADGSWAPVDALSVQIHNLELAIRATAGVNISIEHVKGHAGHGWNELADGVAKSASKGGATFAEPPVEACRTLLDSNLDWLGFEFANRPTAALNIHNRALCWSETNPATGQLRPEHLIPIEDNSNGAPKGRGSSFRIKACTMNVQGLGGNFRYMEEQFEHAAYGVIMLQETKMPGGQCQSKRYIRLSSDSQRHWGTAIWLSKTQGLLDFEGQTVRPDEANITTVCSTPRLLAIVVTIGQAKMALLSGHCPHSTKPGERDEFLKLFACTLTKIKHLQLIVCGVDLNGRIPTEYPQVSGSLDFQEADCTGEKMAQVLQDNGMWVPSMYTNIHVGDSATYTHHTGVESRIDYLMVGGAAWVRSARSHVDATIDNGSPNEDHRAVAIELTGDMATGQLRGRLRRPRYDLEKLNTVRGKEIVSEACRNFRQPHWCTHPDDHCRQVEQHLRTTLEQHFPRPLQHGRATYIPEVVWALRQQKNQLRWRTRDRRSMWKTLLCEAMRRWRSGRAPEAAHSINKQILLYEVMAGAIKVVTYRIRRLVADAKDKFLRGLVAKGPSDVAALLQRAKQAGLGTKSRKMVGRALPKLLDPTTGREAECMADRDQIWLQFFGEQEAGNLLTTERFLRETGNSQDEIRDDWEWKHLPSVREIEQVLRTTAKNKCAGLDGIPSDLLRCSPSDFATMIQPLYLKSLLRGRQPIQWRGGVLYEAYKGAGAQCATDSHRSLYISSFVGKAMHRTMRAKIHSQSDEFLHPLHCGSRQGMPVLFPSLFIVEHLRRCLQQGLSTAVIYVDTKAAYYRLVRQLATGDLKIDNNVEKLFHRFGLDGSDVAELRDLILEGGMLQMAEIDGPIRAAVRDFLRDSRFTSRYTDGTVLCRSTAGSRPGASWADTVFAVIYARILYRVHEVMEGENINFSLPWEPEQGPFAQNPAEHWQPAFDTTWADDSAYAIQAEVPSELIARTKRVGSLIISAFRSHGLDPNLKRHKTSVMVKVRGQGAKKTRRDTFESGKPELFLDDIRESLQVVPSYKHLGCVVDLEANLHLEVRHRTALASAAYDQAKDLLLQNRDLTLQTRSALFQTAVVATYHNLAVWITRGPHWDKMEDAFSRLVRRLLCRDIPGSDLFRVPLQLAHWATGCWTLGMFARRSRLSALVSLARRGPPILWAMLQNEAEWCQQVTHDLEWLVQGESDKWPSVVAEAWPQWWHVLRDQPQAVKRRAKRQQHRDFELYKQAAAVDVCQWYMYRQLPMIDAPDQLPSLWTCGICDKSFGKKSALSVHFFSTHGRRAEYRAFLKGSICQSCHKDFRTPGRLEDHLRANKKCVRALKRSQVPSETVPPGYGSRGRRKQEADAYTPAPPTAGDVVVTDESDEDWNQWQRRLHEDICDALLRPFSPSEIGATIERQVRRHPLYYNEIREVLLYIIEETEVVFADKDLDQWSAQQFVGMRDGLQRLAKDGVQGTSKTQRESQILQSMAEFRRTVDSFDWDAAVKRHQGDNGTQSTPVYSIPDDWETAWKQGCSGVLNAVVVKDPLLLLPKELRAAWQDFQDGKWPIVHGPPSFWRHSLAKPFLPFREKCN